MSAVRFEELFCDNGMRLGLATLDAPKTLNGLSLDICRALADRLAMWAADPRVALVVLAGSGEKAFCAGGDLHSLYRSMREHAGQDAWSNAYAREFFACEYRLDYAIHSYPKPVLCWGHGLVMGGGVGLMAGASHRVVCPSSRLAMPEVTIGLFPDVGGSWFLNRLPGKAGVFLALTGAQLDPADALFAGMADYLLPSGALPSVLETLARQPWAGKPLASASVSGQLAYAARATNDGLLHQALQRAGAGPAPEPGPLRQHLYLINHLCSGADLREIRAGIAGLERHDDPWLAGAAAALAGAAPGSVRLAFALQRHVRLMSLADALRAEYVAALACCAHGDFAEGIRALLVDKDKRPRWRPATPEQADEAWVEPFLQAPWPRERHPLADLGRNPFEQ